MALIVIWAIRLYCGGSGVRAGFWLLEDWLVYCVHVDTYIHTTCSFVYVVEYLLTKTSCVHANDVCTISAAE